MTLAVEGTATYSDLTTPIQITTGGADRIIVIAINCEDPSTRHTVTSVTSSGLTWARRSAFPYTGFRGLSNMEVWWAYAAVTQVAQNVTVNLSGSPDRVVFDIFAVSGVTDFGAPWDGNASLPATAEDHTGSSTAPVCTISTSSPHSIILAFLGRDSGGVVSGPDTGFTANGSIDAGFGFDKASLTGEYKVVSTIQTALAVGWGSTISDWAMITDALRDDFGGTRPTVARAMIIG